MRRYLGDRVELIAAEKAGIIKPGRPVIVGAQESETAQDVLIAHRRRGSTPRVTIYGQDFLAYRGERPHDLPGRVAA